MCLIRMKDDDEYVVPVRVRRVSPPPQRVRMERRSVVRESRSEFGPLPSSVPPAAKPDIPAPSRAPSQRAPSRAPSARSRTRSAYVEVDEEDSSSSESAVSRHTQKTSKSRRPAPSEYSVHEREVRRERGYSRPREEYETYRYVDAPRATSRSGAARSSYYEPTRSSRDGRGFGDIEVDYRRTSRDRR